MTKTTSTSNPFNIVVIVAALGYFVDIYDLILFAIVRVPSLEALGVASNQLKDVGLYLNNMQMIGMMVGGIVWGMLGDKRGRLSTLFLTILLYSLANIANGFVNTVDQYAILRLIAGFGLAGELGVGITLVSEIMTKESRAKGTTLVAGFGVLGAVLAYFVAQWGWRQSYWTGGVLGLFLLGLRVYIHESGMFDNIKTSTVKRGNFLSLFTNGKKLIKYLACILVGVPVWFAIGILIVFAKEFGEVLELSAPVDTGKVIMFHYIGAAIGSITIGYVSQKLKSRKKALIIFITTMAFLCGCFFTAKGISVDLFYLLIFVLGIAMGYWALFVTVASEQFGTNIRSTVTTTVPNFVRGTTVAMTIAWKYLSPGMGIIQAAFIVGAIVIPIAIIAVLILAETHNKDLDYVELD
jgi:MFS transporter, putative metabolite:H+ symporter